MKANHTRKITRQERLAALQSLGFDRVTWANFHMRVHCSQCEALVINGVSTHEHGCPNATHECAGCNAVVPMRQKYCEDCQ